MVIFEYTWWGNLKKFKNVPSKSELTPLILFQVRKFLNTKLNCWLPSSSFNPRIHTVCNRLATFLLAESCYRYLLYLGPAVSTSGSWFLQDGYFSFAAALEVFRRHEVVEAMSRQQGITFDISAFGIGSDWSEASVAKLSPHLESTRR